MTLGSIRLLRAQRAGQELTNTPRLIPAIVILALATVWAQLNFFGYWTTDVTGMAYTLGYCSIQQFRASVPCPFVQQFSAVSFLIAAGIFAASGTLVFWTSKSLFHRTGVVTSIALILAAIYSAAALGNKTRTLHPPLPPLPHPHSSARPVDQEFHRAQQIARPFSPCRSLRSVNRRTLCPRLGRKRSRSISFCCGPNDSWRHCRLGPADQTCSRTHSKSDNPGHQIDRRRTHFGETTHQAILESSETDLQIEPGLIGRSYLDRT